MVVRLAFLALLLVPLPWLAGVGQVATPPPLEATVLVEDFAYAPAETLIAVGGSVTWTIGDDPEQHTITPVDPSAFEDSGQRFQGDTFTVRFAKAGTFEYLCTLHPFMTGTVAVVPVAVASPAAPSRAPSATASSPAAASASPSPEASPAPARTPGADAGPGSLVLLGLATLVIAVAGLLLARSRRGATGRGR